ncbi:MAG: response regulator transcription factor [Gemmatimonadetes bacterium]|nr:response regulator transcription factor [Gemmatimonadota bacterium]
MTKWPSHRSDEPGRSLRVFIVEDSALVRQRLVETLTGLTYVKFVGHAGGVREALEWIPLARPHVVLLDLGLPDGSGLQVLKAIELMSTRPAAVIFTNYATPSLRERCLAAGARAFLDKSHEFHRIPEVLAELAHQPVPTA